MHRILHAEQWVNPECETWTGVVACSFDYIIVTSWLQTTDSNFTYSQQQIKYRGYNTLRSHTMFLCAGNHKFFYIL